MSRPPQRLSGGIATLVAVSKRMFDVTLTLLALPIVAPVTAIMALVLAFELRGSPFFVQERVGMHDRTFRMYKLRTMRHASAGKREQYAIDDWETFVFSPSG